MQGKGSRSYNTAIGSNSQGGSSSTSINSNNTSVGYNSLNAVSAGDDNVAIGKSALYGLTSANYNTALGSGAGGFVVSGSTVKTTGDYGIYIGYNAVALAASSANEIVIGSATSAGGYNTGLGTNSTLIGNSSTTTARIMGDLTLPRTTTSTTTTSGALVVSGGVGIAENLNVGGTLGVTGATSLAALTTTGAATISNTTNSTSTTTGALIVRGGVGIANDVKIGGTIEIDGGSPGAGKVLTSDANGVASWQTGVSTITTKTASYTITNTDNYIIFTTAGTTGQTFTLPSASSAGSGKEFTIKNMSGFNLSVSSTSSLMQEFISSGTYPTTITLGIDASNNWIRVISDGTNWIVFRALF